MLEQWLTIRDLSLDEFKQKYDIQSEHIQTGSSYGQLADLIVIENDETLPGKVYFQDEKFVLLYIRQPDMTATQVKEVLGNVVAVSLRSRAGKQYVKLVYASAGVAYVTLRGKDEIRFIEIFPPQTPDEYRSTLYKAPGKFIR